MVGLVLAPEHRRRRSAVYGGLSCRPLDVARQRGTFARGPAAASSRRARQASDDAYLAVLGRRRSGDRPHFSSGLEEGYGWVDQNIVDGRRQSAADAYLRPVLDRPNLTVVTGALAERLVMDGGRARGVVYSAGGQRHTAACEGEVVLAAGTVGTPQLRIRVPPGSAPRGRRLARPRRLRPWTGPGPRSAAVGVPGAVAVQLTAPRAVHRTEPVCAGDPARSGGVPGGATAGADAARPGGQGQDPVMAPGGRRGRNRLASVPAEGQDAARNPWKDPDLRRYG
ncbi:GMC family oxidoreductase N-terminal domain-containing protein [Streptomyces sp. NPDC004096]|uniref:GMC family oxidoreductase N-terminal domain-containing protein n=1 Tax=unclassified Streptomyces TaxID=2593676 RepID=UPI0033A3C4F7